MADELLRALGRRQRQTPSTDAGAAEDPLNSADSPSAPRATDPAFAEMTRPLNSGEREDLLAAVFAQVDAGATATVDDVAQNETPVAVAAPIDLASRRRTSVAWLAGLAAIAAALVLFFMVRGGPGPDGPTIAALPSYTITQLRGGTAPVRSEPDAPPSEITLAADATIDWRLAPQTPVRVPLRLLIVATAADGTQRLLEPDATTFSSEGVAHLKGSLQSQLGLPAGVWTLNLVVVPANAAVDAPEQALDGRFASSEIRATISPP